MRYAIDTEFNGFGGELLSLALAREDGPSLYLISRDPPPLVDWVAENVWPIVRDCPVDPIEAPLRHWGRIINAFFDLELGTPHVISDWPDDIRYLCQSLITGPGEMVPLRQISFEVLRVDAYPTALPGAVQHNAWWDAMALREVVFSRPALTEGGE